VVLDEGYSVHSMTATLRAPDSDSEQQSRFLTLGSKAHVRHEPRFEVLHDTVKASHGATTTMIDEDCLYYLKSRGIPEQEAKYLCIEGFCQDFLSNMSSQALATMRNMR
jgi:Fe-S cluster assembly protein SufD